MLNTRIYKLNENNQLDGPVVYWMDRDMRINHNWAFLYAQYLAEQKGVPLLVVYNLVSNFLGGGFRQWSFKIGGLQDVEKTCKKHNISFFVEHDTTGAETPELMQAFFKKHNVGAVVTDFSPLKIQKQWKEKISKKVVCMFVEVDAHNIVPARVASKKQEFAAATMRPKLFKVLPTYLDQFAPVKKQKQQYQGAVPEIRWEMLLQEKNIDQKVKAITWTSPGETAAQKHLTHFIEQGLQRYATERNDPLANAQSNLSPYLHYGMISAQHIALSVLNNLDTNIEKVLDAFKNKSKIDKHKHISRIDHAAAFLEELVVRRELSDNYCLYNENYNNPKGYPDWAKRSHQAHKDDEREQLYTRQQLEQAETYDELWNASQRELVDHGKMHGYMRMYWAKKILEWTKNVEEAHEIAIYLNDKYEIDGRDPNGYVGIAWSMGGVHDRAWFSRPIFGLIRYMARSGCDKKFDTKAYIKKYASFSS